MDMPNIPFLHFYSEYHSIIAHGTLPVAEITIIPLSISLLQ
ncbi:hypothetical protein EUBSIR_02139 [[Eubacterium] siraeum DSM 15702]|uniref:Uncharacterized protein n=1 Tax=[Eubacterium] siraeum DSM 15702 TaxID=428128 RepID=B0MQM2_9FIRM|nr:hypothetical protein EUBSIR_02139 [[Eubacterium] siraeum DSM 15702]